MNRKKLATIGCIVLLIVFSLSVGVLIPFKVFLPLESNTYEKILYYPETLYEEYEKEAAGMIARQDYTCQYPVKKTTFYSENGQIDYVEIKIGEYDEGNIYSNYLTATVKNFGTNEQEVAFERSRKSSEQAYEDAERYRTLISIYEFLYIYALDIFIVYIIINAIKGRYKKVLIIILFVALIVITIVMRIH